MEGFLPVVAASLLYQVPKLQAPVMAAMAAVAVELQSIQTPSASPVPVALEP
jgi:hypothetical protein